MSNLKTLLADLQKQLNEALCDPCSSPSSGPRLQAERATLSLKLALVPSTKNATEPESQSFDLLPLQGTASFKVTQAMPIEHTLSIEFRIDSACNVSEHAPTVGSVKPNPIPVLPPVAPLEPPGYEDPMNVLVAALGAPGFDSSARATVFCEALAELDAKQRVAIWNCLGDTRPGTVIDPSLKRARHLLRGALRSGPGGAKSIGPAPIAMLFTQHRSSDLLDLIRAQWKTQADWL